MAFIFDNILQKNIPLHEKLAVHNYLSKANRSPFGAVKSGTTITLSVDSVNGFATEEPFVLLKKDGEEFSHLKMHRSQNPQMTEAGVRFEISILLSEPTIYFYCFKIQTNRGEIFLSADYNGNSQLSDCENCWNVFVFNNEEENLTENECFTNGIMYQIFPDRFAVSKNYAAKKAKNQRFIHYSWNQRPHFIYDQSDYEATDFFMGNLKGITEKLEFIKSLGTTVLYLNPIFEAAANHRYNTADYLSIDPYLGTEEDFKDLCKTAKSLGIAVVIDGVFSHTGADSIYFNKFNSYPELGAYQSEESKYYSWYNFKSSRDDYECWWNFKTLPNVNETNPTFLDFICGDGGVAEKWIKLGANGWRLDVVDELPDEFLQEFHKRVKETKSDAIIIGEVWENAVTKQSYGKRRKYLSGTQIDTTMNYPFRQSIISFLKTGDSSKLFYSVAEIVSSYPKSALYTMMNMLSTHDTVRIITELGVRNRQILPQQMGDYSLTAEEYDTGKYLLFIATMIQYFLPGTASIYYGDEAGLCGFADPWNRRCYPWEKIDTDIIAHFKALGAIKTEYRMAFSGDFHMTNLSKGVILLQYSFAQESEGVMQKKLISAMINMSEYDYAIHLSTSQFKVLLSSNNFEKLMSQTIITKPKSAIIYVEKEMPDIPNQL